MLDAVGLENHIEPLGRVPVARGLTDLDGVVCKYCVDLVWRRPKTASRNSHAVLRFALPTSWATANLLVRSMATKRWSVPSFVRNGALSIVKIANGVSFELLPFGLVTLHIWKARYVMALQTAMQRRTRQMWDRWLQSVEALIQRQQRMAPESQDHRLFIPAQRSVWNDLCMHLNALLK